MRSMLENITVWRVPLVALVTLCMSNVNAVALGEDDWSRHPGYVDGSAFAELAGEDDTLIEVSIRGPLLEMVSKALSHSDEGVSKLLEDIVSISAVIVEVEDNADRARRMTSEMIDRLNEKGWERLVRIRDDDANVVVFVLIDDGDINGLTVIVTERNEGKLVFANIAGQINLDAIGELGANFGIPGLGELTGGDFKADVKKRTRRNRR